MSISTSELSEIIPDKTIICFQETLERNPNKIKTCFQLPIYSKLSKINSDKWELSFILDKRYDSCLMKNDDNSSLNITNVLNFEEIKRISNTISIFKHSNASDIIHNRLQINENNEIDDAIDTFKKFKQMGINVSSSYNKNYYKAYYINSKLPGFKDTSDKCCII